MWVMIAGYVETFVQLRQISDTYRATATFLRTEIDD